MKQFALTLHFYSPRAYDYVKLWTSSVDCEPGFFNDVFSHLSALVSKDPLYSDCALVFDAMTIKSLVYYNKAIDAIEGFVSYGKDIVALDEEAVAKEALFFMLVGIRRSWKYPVGYVLIDGIKSDSIQ